MEKAILPTGKAHEPNEGARNPMVIYICITYLPQYVLFGTLKELPSTEKLKHSNIVLGWNHVSAPRTPVVSKTHNIC